MHEDVSSSVLTDPQNEGQLAGRHLSASAPVPRPLPPTPTVSPHARCPITRPREGPHEICLPASRKEETAEV